MNCVFISIIAIRMRLLSKIVIFFLISKTLNRLYESKIFIKLNLKNVYYKFRIKIDDK